MFRFIYQESLIYYLETISSLRYIRLIDFEVISALTSNHLNILNTFIRSPRILHFDRLNKFSLGGGDEGGRGRGGRGGEGGRRGE